MPATRQLLQRALPSILGSSIHSSQRLGRPTQNGYVRHNDDFKDFASQTLSSGTVRTADMEDAQEQEGDKIELVQQKAGTDIIAWPAASQGTKTTNESPIRT